LFELRQSVSCCYGIVDHVESLVFEFGNSGGLWSAVFSVGLFVAVGLGSCWFWCNVMLGVWSSCEGFRGEVFLFGSEEYGRIVAAGFGSCVIAWLGSGKRMGGGKILIELGLLF